MSRGSDSILPRNATLKLRLILAQPCRRVLLPIGDGREAKRHMLSSES
jgi:hypothetical protein